MAGHSQFKNIMFRKGAQDKKRAKIFTKLIREITVAAKIGDDPASNPALRTAINNARAENMPKDNIERAIKKASGSGEQDNYEEVRYEGYGPAGTAIIVDALTDNRNRTASEVRAAFTKFGGNLGETNSVTFMFDRLGLIQYKPEIASEDAMFEAALEAGASNVESFDDSHDVFCEPGDLSRVRDVLTAKFGDASVVKLIWKPRNIIEVDGQAAETLFKLIDVLEDNDDVQTVSGNYVIADDVLERMNG